MEPVAARARVPALVPTWRRNPRGVDPGGGIRGNKVGARRAKKAGNINVFSFFRVSQ